MSWIKHSRTSRQKRERFQRFHDSKLKWFEQSSWISQHVILISLRRFAKISCSKIPLVLLSFSFELSLAVAAGNLWVPSTVENKRSERFAENFPQDWTSHAKSSSNIFLFDTWTLWIFDLKVEGNFYFLSMRCWNNRWRKKFDELLAYKQVVACSRVYKKRWRLKSQ